MPVQKKKVMGATEGQPRPVLFPKYKVEIHTVATGNPITEDMMKTLLGWEVINAKDGSALGRKDDYQLTYDGKYIKCHNNARNRPYNEEWSHALAQQFLKRQFMFNGETMIIGETGLVLSAQHRGCGYLIACARYRKAKLKQEKKEDLDPDDILILQHWPNGAPVFESIIVYGIKEDHATVSTLDYNRPRSFGDVLYTSGIFAGGKKVFGNGERERMTKMLGNCVKLVWERTGMKKNKDELTEYLTNPELTQYVTNHPKLADAVKHIYGENLAKKKDEKTGPIANLIGPGTAAGLLYLMGMSNCDVTKYQASHPREEKALKFDSKTWQKAEQFWTNLVIVQQQRCPEVAALIEAFKQERNTETGKEASIKVERFGLALRNAWKRVSRSWVSSTLRLGHGQALRCGTMMTRRK